MPNLPNLTTAEVKLLVAGAEDIQPAINGGQKLVFLCRVGGAPCALKFLLSNPAQATANGGAPPDVVFERVMREVQILEQCHSPHLPRLGPVALQQLNHNGQDLVLFSEEIIDGTDLNVHLQQNGSLDAQECITLATHINHAIESLWEKRKIHRDIKPANIMRRDNGIYVLLDPGIVFDLDGPSLTAAGLIPHTPGYLAPEYLTQGAKRDADVRADLFLLGIVLYEASTGRHPFLVRPNMDPLSKAQSILTYSPPPPHTINPAIPNTLSSFIMRLLQKPKHLRYRDCGMVREALANI